MGWTSIGLCVEIDIQAFPNVGWMGGNEGIRIGHGGFDSSIFRVYFGGPGGSVRDHFPIFGDVPVGPYYFHYDIPIPPVWLCCAVYFILSSCVLSVVVSLLSLADKVVAHLAGAAAAFKEDAGLHWLPRMV